MHNWRNNYRNAKIILTQFIKSKTKKWFERHRLLFSINFSLTQFLFGLFCRMLDTEIFHLISCTNNSGITWSVDKHDSQRVHNTSCFGIEKRYLASKYFVWYYTLKWSTNEILFLLCLVLQKFWLYKDCTPQSNH